MSRPWAAAGRRPMVCAFSDARLECGVRKRISVTDRLAAPRRVDHTGTRTLRHGLCSCRVRMTSVETKPRGAAASAADPRRSRFESDGERERTADDESPERLIVLSNRGPLTRSEAGWRRSSGGLVTALDPLLRRRRGTWVSAREPGDVADVPDLGYEQRGIELPPEIQEGFYAGFANGVLWPTLHGFPTLGQVDDAPWGAYEAANRSFAEAALEGAEEGDLLWVHDYHLMRAPLLVRNTHAGLRIGWFCHIPWPDADQFATLPWRRELVEGLLGADVLGFHSARYAAHFLECAREFADASVDMDAGTVSGGSAGTRILVAPIGIPVKDLSELVESEEVRQREDELRRAVQGRRIVLGVDRLDYTKGIPERLSAFARLLENEPSLREELVMIQIVVPSRESVGAYADLKESLDRQVGQINGQFSRTGQVPIHYIYRSLGPRELYAHYRAADVALVTPLRDGMNLVALEYVAARSDEQGALVLSEFAGAAEHLDQAYLVNPYDVDSVAAELQRALNAPRLETKQRMRALRAVVQRLDVHAWADGFLRQLRSPRSEGMEAGAEIATGGRPSVC